MLPVSSVQTHIPHVTIACNMELEDAVMAYQEFREMNGDRIRCNIDLDNCDVLGPDYYPDATNSGWSWGYDVRVDAKIPTNIDVRCQPRNHHITMQYAADKNCLRPLRKQMMCSLVGSLEVVDIRSDDPGEWRLITERDRRSRP